VLHRQAWTLRLTRNLLLWLPVSYVVWLLLTPFYNTFLAEAAQNLVRLTESPSVTRLTPHDANYLVVTHDQGDLAGKRIYSVRTTDIHFNLVLLAALFLAVPGASAKRRWACLGYALLFAVFFHLIDLFFWVKFAYATQLGSWSAEHYGAFGQNFWGLGKHLLDLPFKLGLPLLLWGYFFLGELLGPVQDSRTPRS
jgi:hypothetical protein